MEIGSQPLDTACREGNACCEPHARRSSFARSISLSTSSCRPSTCHVPHPSFSFGNAVLFLRLRNACLRRNSCHACRSLQLLIWVKGCPRQLPKPWLPNPSTLITPCCSSKRGTLPPSGFASQTPSLCNTRRKRGESGRILLTHTQGEGARNTFVGFVHVTRMLVSSKTTFCTYRP